MNGYQRLRAFLVCGTLLACSLALVTVFNACGSAGSRSPQYTLVLPDAEQQSKLTSTLGPCAPFQTFCVHTGNNHTEGQATVEVAYDAGTYELVFTAKASECYLIEGFQMSVYSPSEPPTCANPGSLDYQHNPVLPGPASSDSIRVPLGGDFECGDSIILYAHVTTVASGNCTDLPYGTPGTGIAYDCGCEDPDSGCANHFDNDADCNGSQARTSSIIRMLSTSSVTPAIRWTRPMIAPSTRRRPSAVRPFQLTRPAAAIPRAPRWR